MLTSNKDISIPPESQFIIKLASFLELKSSKNLNSYSKEILELLYSNVKFQEWEISRKKLEGFIQKNKDLSLSNFLYYIYDCYRKINHPNASLLGDKNPDYLYHLPKLEKIFPEAKFIIIYRDPRAILNSLKKVKKDWNSSFSENELTIKSIKKIVELLKNKNLKKNYFIKFEDLICTPEIELKKICTWLQLSYDKNMLEYSKLNKQKELVPSNRLKWHSNTLKHPDKKIIKKWKNNLNNKEIANIEHELKKEMNELGYKMETPLMHSIYFSFKRLIKKYTL